MAEGKKETGKIVFTLNNTGLIQSCCELFFNLFETFMDEPKSEVFHFQREAEYFPEEDFSALNKKIAGKKSLPVPMNEAELIIFFTVVHFACKTLVNRREEKMLREQLGAGVKFEMIRQKAVSFGAAVITKLKSDMKQSPQFRLVAKKISAY